MTISRVVGVHCMCGCEAGAPHAALPCSEQRREGGYAAAATDPGTITSPLEVEDILLDNPLCHGTQPSRQHAARNSSFPYCQYSDYEPLFQSQTLPREEHAPTSQANVTSFLEAENSTNVSFVEESIASTSVGSTSADGTETEEDEEINGSQEAQNDDGDASNLQRQDVVDLKGIGAQFENNKTSSSRL